jgi:hypothetical protein
MEFGPPEALTAFWQRRVTLHQHLRGVSMFKKKTDAKLLKYPTITSFWDQKKVETIATHQRIEINLTSFIDEKRAGRLADYAALESSQEAHGFTDWPRSLVTITFDDAPVKEHPPPKPPTIGMWKYEVFGTDREGYVGRLLFTFFDQDHSVRLALRQAHAASLSSGLVTTRLLIFKEDGVGAFSTKDREHGYSYESRYPFCGFGVTERYQSLRLQKWAVPYLDEDFSKEDAPF